MFDGVNIILIDFIEIILTPFMSSFESTLRPLISCTLDSLKNRVKSILGAPKLVKLSPC